MKRPVVVLELPEKMVLNQAREFFYDVQEFLQTEKPRLVFDFSSVTQMDSAGIEVLLNSMEQVLKRNGDLKLAAIAGGPKLVLELTQVDDLFEIFDNAADAAESFHHFPVSAFSGALPDQESAMGGGAAA